MELTWFEILFLAAFTLITVINIKNIKAWAYRKAFVHGIFKLEEIDCDYLPGNRGACYKLNKFGEDTGIVILTHEVGDYDGVLTQEGTAIKDGGTYEWIGSNMSWGDSSLKTVRRSAGTEFTPRRGTIELDTACRVLASRKWQRKTSE